MDHRTWAEKRMFFYSSAHEGLFLAPGWRHRSPLWISSSLQGHVRSGSCECGSGASGEALGGA